MRLEQTCPHLRAPFMGSARVVVLVHVTTAGFWSWACSWGQERVAAAEALGPSQGFLRQGWPNSNVFGTGLDPICDHLLGLRRPAKFRSLCRDYLLGYRDRSSDISIIVMIIPPDSHVQSCAPLRRFLDVSGAISPHRHETFWIGRAVGGNPDSKAVIFEQHS